MGRRDGFLSRGLAASKKAHRNKGTEAQSIFESLRDGVLYFRQSDNRIYRIKILEPRIGRITRIIVERGGPEEYDGMAKIGRGSDRL